MKKMKKKGKINLGDIAKKLGAAWGKLSEKDKAVFVEKSTNAKAEYEVAIENYNSNL